ncbi:MAG TPA: MBL fold metallo-hydrolase [Terriglobia bacterium]|jgi:glyoxylase-like metal-dependent hydrolase (beta-lactamase superfamily II)
MIIETFPVGWLQCNCTIIGDEQTGEAIVIDPGDDPMEILTRLEKHGLTVRQIVCTHTHIDHVGAISELQEKSGAPASIHKADLLLFEKLDMQAQWIGMPMPKRGAIEHFVEDGGAVACRGVEVGVIHTPGHTPGSATFHLAADRNILFTGDTLFAQSIGRTDLWGGSQPQILTSIQKKLMPFDDDTLVIAGHGQSTTIGHERRYNPFLK